jgi:hypothetical protein
MEARFRYQHAKYHHVQTKMAKLNRHYVVETI